MIGAPLGRWQTNCFIVGDRAAGTCVVIDPGEGGAEFVASTLGDESVSCEAILLTHGHLDHLWAVPELADDLDVPVFLHPDDRWLWDDPAGGLGFPSDALEQFLGRPWNPPSERLEDLHDEQELVAGRDIRLVARHTPGHTPGHVTFTSDDLADAEVAFQNAPEPDADVLFAGDLVFQGSVGRTDFPRGSSEQLLEAIARTVLPLADDTLVLTGHGPRTTVGRERRSNPFLRQIIDDTSAEGGAADRGGTSGAASALWTPGGRRT